MTSKRKTPKTVAQPGRQARVRVQRLVRPSFRALLCTRIGNKLRELRQARQSTLPMVAAKTGLPKSLLSQIENGKGNPTLETLHLLASANNIALSELTRPCDDLIA